MFYSKAASPPFSFPIMAGAMKPMLRKMMNGMMAINGGAVDCSYAEVSSFMVPKMFDPADKDKWALFQAHRPYCVPGYKTKAPQPGDKVPDGPLLSLEEGGPKTTLLAEARKLAKAAGSSKVILSFDSITCPFWRSYGAEDLYYASNGVPTLHVYIREAHPFDEFPAEGAEGPNAKGPIALTRVVNKHKTIADRRLAASEAKALVSKYEGPNVAMFVDELNDKLEKMYEARPWRMYVIEAESAKMIDAISLTPFNMDGKIAAISAATK